MKAVGHCARDPQRIASANQPQQWVHRDHCGHASCHGHMGAGERVVGNSCAMAYQHHVRGRRQANAGAGEVSGTGAVAAAGNDRLGPVGGKWAVVAAAGDCQRHAPETEWAWIALTLPDVELLQVAHQLLVRAIVLRM